MKKIIIVVLIKVAKTVIQKTNYNKTKKQMNKNHKKEKNTKKN